MNQTRQCISCMPGTVCCCCVEVAAPHSAATCKLCGGRGDMYCEIPVNGDYYGRGFVMRIGCVCDAAMEVEGKGWRTEFETYHKAVRDWNEMQHP